jgi:hypothetical protein
MFGSASTPPMDPGLKSSVLKTQQLVVQAGRKRMPLSFACSHHQSREYPKNHMAWSRVAFQTTVNPIVDVQLQLELQPPRFKVRCASTQLDAQLVNPEMASSRSDLV